MNLIEKYLGEAKITWIKSNGTDELFDKGGEVAKIIAMTNYDGFDLFVIKRGNKIIPVHGGVEMKPVSNVQKAKDQLIIYVDGLPDKSKIKGSSDNIKMSSRLGKTLAYKYDR